MDGVTTKPNIKPPVEIAIERNRNEAIIMLREKLDETEWAWMCIFTCAFSCVFICFEVWFIATAGIWYYAQIALFLLLLLLNSAFLYYFIIKRNFVVYKGGGVPFGYFIILCVMAAVGGQFVLGIITPIVCELVH